MTVLRVPPPYVPPPATAQVTVYEHAEFIVIEKPSGLLSVPGIGPEKQVCAASYAAERYGPVLIVHRLDMDTSGLMVLARTAAMQRHLSHAFQARAVEKRYQALVEGTVAEPSGRIDAAIARYSHQRPLRHLEVGGRRAITAWKRVAVAPDGDHSRVDLFPETGRSHQLRLHMQSIGHSILGDPFYGDAARYARLALHATHLAFSPSPDVSAMRFSSPAPF